MLTKKYYKLIRVSYADSDLFRITNISDQAGTLTVGTPGSTLECSTDGATWFNYTESITVAAGANVYMKANGGVSDISMDVNHSIGGNILSLADKTNYASITTINTRLIGLFSSDSHLIDAYDVNFGNATSVYDYTLSNVFQNCTSLTTPPDLSGITSVGTQGMQGMFSGCSSLTTAPELSGITTIGNAAMQNMFASCSSLTTPPDLSGITSISGSGMNSMFSNCTSLVTAPDLSGVTSISGSGMQSMFQNCSSLVTAPDLSGVTSVGTQGFGGTFYNCRLLSTAYAPNVSSWNTSDSNLWLYNVATTGTLYCPSQAVADAIPDNTNAGCPSGWTKVVM